MRQKQKIILRPVRILVYLVLLGLDFFFLFFLGNYFWWVTAILLIVFPILSVTGLIRMAAAAKLELGAGARRAVCGDIIPLELRIQNPGWYPVPDVRIALEIANTFFSQKSDITVSMAAGMRNGGFLRLPVEMREQGRFTVTAVRADFQDVLGLVKCRRIIGRECEIFILPPNIPVDWEDTEQYLAGAAETEESTEKGNDFSEVSDIRNYIPGDRFRDIHWKLSARSEELMVKQRVSMAGSEMVMVLVLSEDRQETEEILKTVYGFALSLIQHRLPVCLLCWNQEQFRFEEYRCGTVAELEDIYCDLYRTAVSLRIGGEQKVYVRNCYPYLKNYLMILQQDGRVQVEMCENDS